MKIQKPSTQIQQSFAFPQNFLEALPINSAQNQLSQNSTKIKPDPKILNRDEFFFKIRSIMQQISQNEDKKAQEIVFKYLIESQNPIYDKILKLPKTIYTCGNCKGMFAFRSQYLQHLLQMECQINHERSTHFFTFKNKLLPTTKESMKTQMSEQDFVILQRVRLNKSSFCCSKFAVIKKSNSTYLVGNKNQCGKCYKKMPGLSRFALHCIAECSSYFDSANSATTSVADFKQTTLEFIQGVQNFHLNYNIITLCEDFYVKIQVNPEFKPNKSHQNTNFCANCDQEYPTSMNLLAHSLFQCKKKPSKLSSHLIRRQLISNQNINEKRENQVEGDQNESKDNENTNKRNKLLGKEETNQQTNRMNDILEDKVNQKYQEYSQLLTEIYFCGVCQHYFLQRQKYFAHCLLYLCELNHKRSSHHFFVPSTGSFLKIQELRQKIPMHCVNETIQKREIIKDMQMRYSFIDNKTKKTDNVSSLFKCGVCKRQFVKKIYFVQHVLFNCFSALNPANSHCLRFERQISEKKMMDTVKSIVFGHQLNKIQPKKCFLIAKIQGQKNTWAFFTVDVAKAALTISSNSCTIQQLYANHGKIQTHLTQSSLSKTKNPNLTSLQLSSNAQRWQKKVKNNFNLGQASKVSNRKIDFKENQTDIQQFQQQKSHFCDEKINSRGQLNGVKKQKIQFQTQKNQVSNKNKHFIPSKTLQIDSQKQQLTSIRDQTPEKIQETPPIEAIKTRKLRPNIDFIRQSNQKYFCEPCDTFFKRRERFINHLNVCLNFQHAGSSHFYITNDRMQEKNRLCTINIQTLKNKIEVKSFMQYNQKKYTCGCGSNWTQNQYINHMTRTHSKQIPKGSSHIIVKLNYMNKKQQSGGKIILLIPLVIKKTNDHNVFVCPCRPLKKYTHKQFFEHVMLRHGGTTPICQMKSSPNGQIQFINEENSDIEI